MASNASTSGEQEFLMDPEEHDKERRCVLFIREFLNAEGVPTVSAICNRVGLIAGSTTQRNNLFRLFLAALVNPDAGNWLTKMTRGSKFVDGYLWKGSDLIQSKQLTELSLEKMYEVFPFWFARIAFVVLKNMVFLLRCLKHITGEDGKLVFRSITDKVTPVELAIPDESVMSLINKNYGQKKSDDKTAAKLKRDRDEDADLDRLVQQASKKRKIAESEKAAAESSQSSSSSGNASGQSAQLKRDTSMNMHVTESDESPAHVANDRYSISNVTSSFVVATGHDQEQTDVHIVKDDICYGDSDDDFLKDIEHLASTVLAPSVGCVTPEGLSKNCEFDEEPLLEERILSDYSPQLSPKSVQISDIDADLSESDTRGTVG
eukprot:891611_1